MEKLNPQETTRLVNWFRMVKIINRTNYLSEKHLAGVGLTLAQFDTLNQIERHQPLTQQQLGEHLMVSRGGVSQMLRRLEENGWIERQQEWREKYIYLTTVGKELMKEIQIEQAHYQASMLASLTDQENQELARLLKKIEADVNQKEIIEYEK